eukprot:1017501-Prorocentrum_minimum.AAC.1
MKRASVGRAMQTPQRPPPPIMLEPGKNRGHTPLASSVAFGVSSHRHEMSAEFLKLAPYSTTRKHARSRVSRRKRSHHEAHFIGTTTESCERRDDTARTATRYS